MPNNSRSNDFEIIHLETSEGLRLEGNHFKRGNRKVIVVAHGFMANKDIYDFRAISESFLPDYDVIAMNFRGHGTSEGLFTFTSKEGEDLIKFLEFARNQYEKIGLVGFSLGAAVSIIISANTQLADSLIVVSAPYDFQKIDKQFWRKEAFEDLRYNLSLRGWGKGVRIGNPFLVKLRPLDYVDKTPPILFLHGTHDWLVGLHHSERLFKAARSRKELKVFQGGYHAERLFQQFPDLFRKYTQEWFQHTL